MEVSALVDLGPAWRLSPSGTPGSAWPGRSRGYLRTGPLRGITTRSGLWPRPGASGCACPGHCLATRRKRANSSWRSAAMVTGRVGGSASSRP